MRLPVALGAFYQTQSRVCRGRWPIHSGVDCSKRRGSHCADKGARDRPRRAVRNLDRSEPRRPHHHGCGCRD
eukprot:7259685-Prymnesium_polylepis.1